MLLTFLVYGDDETLLEMDQLYHTIREAALDRYLFLAIDKAQYLFPVFRLLEL
jgi:hypothetical protein